MLSFPLEGRGVILALSPSAEMIWVNGWFWANLIGLARGSKTR